MLVWFGCKNHLSCFLQILTQNKGRFVTELGIQQYLGLIKNNFHMIHSGRHKDTGRERKLFYQVGGFFFFYLFFFLFCLKREREWGNNWLRLWTRQWPVVESFFGSGLFGHGMIDLWWDCGGQIVVRSVRLSWLIRFMVELHGESLIKTKWLQIFHKTDSVRYMMRGHPPPVRCSGAVRDFIMKVRVGEMKVRELESLFSF